MDRDKALAKIKKCLALGRSSNEHEASAAMRQAQKLMAEFDLDDRDVALSDVVEARTRAVMQTIVAWEVELARMIADAFGCDTFVSRHVLPGRCLRARLMRHFVGVGTYAEVAQYAFEVLSRQCAKARLAHIADQPRNCKPITKTARGDKFALYWVFAVRDLVQRFAGSERNTLLVEAYMQRVYPDLASVMAKRRDVGRNVRDGSAWAGAAAGGKATLNQGVGSAGAPQALTVGEA